MSCKRRYTGIIVMAVVLIIMATGISLAQEVKTLDNKSAPYQEYIAKLAGHLGIEQTKVEAALFSTRKQMLTEAVEQGRLTKEQADHIAQNSNPFWFEPYHKKHGGKEVGRYLHGDIAKILGISAEQFNAEIKSGKKLTQIIKERGLTEQQFRQKMLETKKQSLSKLVTDRKLTQEQADKNMKRMEQKLNCLLSDS